MNQEEIKPSKINTIEEIIVIGAHTPDINGIHLACDRNQPAMAESDMAVAGHLTVPKEHHYRRGKRNILFYAMVSFAVFWLQLSANIFVFCWKHKDDPRIGSTPGHFPLQPRPFSYKDELDIRKVGNLRSKNSFVTSDNISKEQQLSISSLQDQLLGLSKQLEKVQKTLQEEEEASLAVSENPKVFIPFTIRDAQRTVPTQIPHGFEIFDFIDLYATNGDQNQTARSEAKSSGNQEEHDDMLNDVQPPGKASIEVYLNGKPLSVEVENDIGVECAGYSKRCYRSKFLLVARYLLSLHASQEQKTGNNDGNEKDVDYYYFYMEADNDLCVPLNEIRSLAFQHERYFISAGTGASGWIMSHQFLKDFHSFWNSIDETNRRGLSGEQIFEPDSVAGRLLQEKLAWSVTRRYLTSHSILSGTTSDEKSIGALFERVDQVIPEDTTETDTKEIKSTTMAKKKKETPEEAAKKAPIMEPSRYLPRCLEPHRGVWKKELIPEDEGVENDFDVQHWGFFDYSLCPESDVFPCAEGQLMELAKKDPYFETMYNIK